MVVEEKNTLVWLERSLLAQVSAEILMHDRGVEVQLPEGLETLRGDGDVDAAVLGAALQGHGGEVGEGLGDGVEVVGLDVEGLVAVVGDLGGRQGQRHAEGCEELHFVCC